MKRVVFFLSVIFILFVSLANAANEYGQGEYGEDIYGSATPTSTESPNAESNSASSNSGGGFPSFSSSENELSKGYNKIMLKDWKISFKVNGEAHTFKVDNLSETDVKISISSETQEATLLIGEEKKFELSGDNYYDVLVKLNSIDASNKLRLKADLTIYTIYEEIAAQQESKVEEGTEEITLQQESKSDKDPKENSESGLEESTINSTVLWFLLGVIIFLILFGIHYKKLK